MMQHIKKFKEGYILLEGGIIIGILGILLAVMLPTYVQGVKKAEERVCKTNCQQLQRIYETQLILQGEVHSEELFNRFMETQSGECCPEGGEIKYEEGAIICTQHDGESE